MTTPDTSTPSARHPSGTAIGTHHPRAADRSAKGGEMSSKTPSASMFQNIPLASITPDPNQPRKAFDDESLASLAHRLAEAQRFLTALDDEAEFWTFQTFDDSGQKRGKLTAVLHGDIEELFNRLDSLNANGAGVYVTVNETDGKGRETDNIVRVRAGFADFDPPKTAAAPASYPLEPVIVVESSPGKHHAYWTADDLALDDFENQQRGIAAALGSDTAPHDLPRVMRLPGFRHMKDPSKPHPVRIVSTEPRLPYPAAELARAFPPVAKVNGSGKASSERPDTNQDPVVQALSERGLVIGKRQDAAFNIRCPWEDEHTTPSTATSTVYYPPHTGGYEGAAFKCQHEHCRDRTAAELRRVLGLADGPSAEHGASVANDLLNGQRQSQSNATPALEPHKSQIRQCDMSKLGSAELAPPSFIIRPLLPRKHLTLFGSHGGSGKTTLALVIAAHVACGEPWADLETHSGRVLFVSFEDDEDLMLWRLQNIAEHYRLPLETIRENMVILDTTEAQPMVYEMMLNGVRGISTSLDGDALHKRISDEQFDLVIIDNASDAYDADEINRRMTRQFIRWLAKSVQGHGGSVLLLAHIDKASAKFGSNGNSYSGSTAWHNSARSRLALVNDELHHEKLNVGKKLERPIPLTWHDPGVPVPSAVSSASMAQTLIDAQSDKAVLAAMTAAIGNGESIPTSSTGSHTSWHKLRAYPELPAHLSEKAGKRDFDKSIVRLQKDGKIEREDYTDAHRNARQRWALSQCASVRVDEALTQTDAGTSVRARQCAGGMGDQRNERTDADPKILPAVFGSKAHLSESALTQKITEQTGITKADADRLILSAVTQGHLLREKGKGEVVYRLPAAKQEASA